MKDGALGASAAIAQVEEIVRGGANEKDVAYFIEHRGRFERTLRRMTELAPLPAKVLDIGSHYLHLSLALRAMDYHVVSIDAPAFADQPLMRARAQKGGIDNLAVGRLDDGDFLQEEGESFDAVVFTEIMEHITFNPVLLWRRVYDLLHVGGFVYITTPNSLTPWKMLHVLKRMTTLAGVGVSPEEIMHTVTYGHHWKEYSGDEIRKYFALMSPDFSVEIAHFNEDWKTAPRDASIKSACREFVRGVAANIPILRDQIEAIVRLDRRTRWLIEPPGFI